MDDINTYKLRGTKGSSNNGKGSFKEALAGMNTKVTKFTPIVFNIRMN